MLLKKLLRVCDEEMRRVFEAFAAVYEHVRELDEQALRSLGVEPRGPRSR